MSSTCLQDEYMASCNPSRSMSRNLKGYTGFKEKDCIQLRES